MGFYEGDDPGSPTDGKHLDRPHPMQSGVSARRQSIKYRYLLAFP